MRTAAFVLVGASVAAAATWALVSFVLYPDVVLNYRLMAEVEMRGKTYTGSAVIKTRWRQTLLNPLGLADDWSEREMGEAVVVDMAEEGVVLVTMAGYTQQQPKLLPQMVFGPEEGARTFRGHLQALARDRRVKRVEPKRVPVVIWLKDRLDPSSAACIEPDGGALADANVPTFPRVQMQMTDEPPTERIYTILPWLIPIAESYDLSVDGSPS